MKVTEDEKLKFTRRLAEINDDAVCIEELDATAREEELFSLALRGELELDDLTYDERQNFFHCLRQGNIPVNDYIPFWYDVSLPTVSADILEVPHLCCSPTRPLDPSVVALVIEVCYCVAFLCRLTQGEFENEATPETSSCMLHLLPHLLGKHTELPGLVELVYLLRERVAAPPVSCTDSWLSTNVFRDVTAALETSRHALRLVELAHAKAKALALDSPRLVFLEKKLLFVASVVCHHLPDELVSPPDGRLVLDVKLLSEVLSVGFETPDSADHPASFL
ncbi:MAG: hypothetical protein KVP17_004180 [Porospora cf. gigantea B]|uniref:uncharacterized protein n=1 Tax=Porospora cf. gigantea B TaxID=2853592 RepID=UPI003571BF43|nr:MAG: hypothetical protein KVP17_004180 [Porospora cf. gigantea B]